MMDIPIAFKKRTSYENFVAECPWCGEESTFNRASDLGTFEPIAGQDVSCLNTNCGKLFRITGDSVNNPHEMLIFDCYELIKRKHYMNSILTLAQAYEIFFNLYFRVELLYKPYVADRGHDLGELNRLSEMLHDKIAKHTFERMRAMFLRLVMSGSSPRNLLEAKNTIANLPDRPNVPKDLDIESISDTTLVPLLIAVKTTNINTLRNSIVHKQAYRPTREEVEKAFKETRSILFPLTYYLQLYDDINWYRKEL